MDNSLRYSEILTQVLRRSASVQPRLQPISIRAVCDIESGQFLIIATGWEKNIWMNTILFHAQLANGKVVIEDDNFEEGLTEVLITAGIAPEDIVTGLAVEQRQLSLYS
ncbi:XisI protein [Dolichospermum sp. ST_con]|nr:XisI protein [Dolichospermum sp. ST_con]MDD1420285.1 XisI protein [Dolichospermum sp. ST_sed1]MDD1427778.1 XisI protein [Dolichospermum sp. ST_sed9]MDD1434086.1 XisI protein [Dolichospermum sp. ST_sed6]MDD1437403.1 XisI protein [Dolichospermum sp. ST_sed10]MDD1443476.1 XisI protein [Dolichospermum sp. ST_sed3]MDD1449098.1 XisI protein [Dolichospermum sp. ST_sed8]MDD1457743.1 XisI protein [Dolichospermum sp. ST_sed7]MDD1459159.1 XisI protein [Dolichospermum sp. ST_sed2]MDD1467636.1 XisI 